MVEQRSMVFLNCYLLATVLVVLTVLGVLARGHVARAQTKGACILPDGHAGKTIEECAQPHRETTNEVTIVGSPGDAKVFDMDEQACLRGGLTFYDLDGKVIFDLKDGEYYPQGCEKSR